MEPLLALSNDLAGAVARVAGGVVGVNARRRLPSTGVCWRPGIVVTADHTVEIDEDITITRPDGARVPATLAGRDPGTDLAVVKVSGDGLAVVEKLDGAALKIGHIVLALGRGPTASWGIISALGGGFRTWSGGQIDRLIRLDLTLYPGFSGGPLVDTQGRVIGINTSGLTRRTALAIPASTVDRITDELATRGRVARGYLGVAMQPVRLPETLRRSLGIQQESAVIVLTVDPEGPAARAGMLMGDVVIAIADTPVHDPDDMRAACDSHRNGTAVKIAVVRAGARVELTATIGERPRGR